MAKPRPRSSDVPSGRAIGLRKMVEDGGLNRGVNPNPRIRHLKRQHALRCMSGAAFDRDMDSPPVGKLHGIPDQVPENLTKTDRISDHSMRTAVPNTAGQFQALCSGRFKNKTTASSTNSRKSNTMASKPILPASILEKSRMSLIIVSKATPERWTDCASCNCRSFNAVRSSGSYNIPRYVSSACGFHDSYWLRT